MKKIFPQLILPFLYMIVLLGSASGAKRAITEKDLFQFNWVGNPQLSPDGSQVAFVRIVVDAKREDYETSLWSVPVN